MTLAAALTRLATWTVTGVTTHYAYSDKGMVIPEAQLPALVPELDEGGGYEAINVALTSGIMTIRLNHLLLVRGYGMGIPLARDVLTVTLIDNYFAKLITDATLNNELIEGIGMNTLEIGPTEYGGIMYQAIKFPHVWKVKY